MLRSLTSQQQSILLEALLYHFQLERASRVPAGHWNQFEDKLLKAGLGSQEKECLTFWASHRSHSQRQENIPLRVLPPFEKEVLTVEAHGYLLEITQVGLLAVEQLEVVLEECFYVPNPPVGKKEIQDIILRILGNHLDHPSSSTFH